MFLLFNFLTEVFPSISIFSTFCNLKLFTLIFLYKTVSVTILIFSTHFPGRIFHNNFPTWNFFNGYFNFFTLIFQFKIFLAISIFFNLKLFTSIFWEKSIFSLSLIFKQILPNLFGDSACWATSLKSWTSFNSSCHLL